MSAFHFKNFGLLPIEAITTLGVSVKEGDNAIGRFGTGLKYTIAGVLRMGEEISIQVGKTIYYFASEVRAVRGKNFQFVKMIILEQGVPERSVDLGFTTDLGRHWEPWMFIRELWSNMKDEGGSHDWGIYKGADNETVITIQGFKMEQAYKTIDSFILNTIPLEANGYAENHGKADGAGIYFQGIKVGEVNPAPMRKFNLIEAELTEDRTLKYPHHAAQACLNFIMHSRDEALIEELITTHPDTPRFEFSANMWTGDSYSSSTFNEVVKKFWETKPYLLHNDVRNWAKEQFKLPPSAQTFTLTPVEKSKFDKALAFIKRLGFDRDIEWTFVSPEDNSAFGFVEGNKVYITRMAFQNGTQFLAQTMIEEYIHRVDAVPDYSRSFQDNLLRRIVSLGEEMLGETL